MVGRGVAYLVGNRAVPGENQVWGWYHTTINDFTLNCLQIYRQCSRGNHRVLNLSLHVHTLIFNHRGVCLPSGILHMYTRKSSEPDATYCSRTRPQNRNCVTGLCTCTCIYHKFGGENYLLVCPHKTHWQPVFQRRCCECSSSILYS